MPKEGTSLCASMCVQFCLPACVFLCHLSLFCCLSVSYRERPQGAAEGILSLAWNAGSPPETPPSSFFLPLLYWEQEEGGSNDTLGSQDPRHIQCKVSKDETTLSFILFI